MYINKIKIFHFSDISVRKYLCASVGIVSLLTENLLSHPFVVLRRQCQVHHTASKFHLTPLTLVKPIIRLHKRQGVTTLWKGLGSCLLVRGMSLAVEDAISKFTPWPKKIHSHTSFKQFGQHILLKCISISVVMPFYAASLVETVQSDIASEKPGVFDIFREGASRLLALNVPQKGRMLPVWVLIGPCVGIGLSKYLFSVIVQGISTRIMAKSITNRQIKRGAKPRDISTENQNIEIYSTLMSIVLSETVFFPMETIIHRMQLQGTRTIIDNLDTGSSVVPILTSYEGFIDCYRTTIASEGAIGLYKGFGAMVGQFIAHIAVIKITKWIITQIAEVCSTKPPQKVADFYNLKSNQKPTLDPVGFGTAGDFTSSSTTISRSLSSNINSISD